MKKILSVLFALTVFVSAITAKDSFLSHRYFEIVLDVPAQVSNNYIKVGDLLNGGELVIDFTELANTLPSYGYRVAAAVNPEFGFGLNLPKVSTGVFAGFDVSASTTIGKGLFEFLGYGNELYEDINVDADVSADIFATVRVPVSIDIRRINFRVEPTVFIPVVHAGVENANFKIQNNENAEFIVNGEANLNLFTLISYDSLLDERGQFSVSSQSISEMVTAAFGNGCLGFDMSGSFNYRFSDILMLTSNCRIPIVPGKLEWRTPVKCSVDYKTSATEMMGSEGVTAPQVTMDKIASVYDPYRLNRPLKMNAGVRYSPFETEWIVLNGMAGFGIKHPFSSYSGEAKFYPEYDLSATLSLASLLKLKLSASYIDQIFMNQAVIGLNVRIVEVNLGISSQSTSLASVFKGCGMGAFVNLAIGF